MRPFLLAIAFLTALPFSASAEDDPHSRDRTKETPTTYVTLELQGIYLDETETFTPDLNGTIVRLLRGPFGAYTFFYVDRDYAEAIVGPLFAPTDWLVIGAGAGIEQAGEAGSWRVGGMLWLSNYRFASTTFVETGASGFWARSEFVWKPDFLDGSGGIGLLGDTLLGAGPRVEVNIPKTPFQLWGATLYDPELERANFACGLRLNI